MDVSSLGSWLSAVAHGADALRRKRGIGRSQGRTISMTSSSMPSAIAYPPLLP